MNNLTKNHVWRRALKVLYIFALLLTCILSVRFIYISKKPKEVYDKTIIQCYSGNTYIANEKNCESESGNINFDYSSIFLINRLCETGQVCNSNNQSFKERLQEKIKINREINRNPPVKSFNIIRKQKTLSSWTNVIVFSILAFILIIFIFEIIRRIFYYIIYGKFIIKNLTKK